MINQESENTMALAILEAAIDGVTESYLLTEGNRTGNGVRKRAAGKGEENKSLKTTIAALVVVGMLRELASADRAFVAYRTTQKGLLHLMLCRSLRSAGAGSVRAGAAASASPAVVEA